MQHSFDSAVSSVHPRRRLLDSQCRHLALTLVKSSHKRFPLRVHTHSIMPDLSLQVQPLLRHESRNMANLVQCYFWKRAIPMHTRLSESFLPRPDVFETFDAMLKFLPNTVEEVATSLTWWRGWQEAIYSEYGWSSPYCRRPEEAAACLKNNRSVLFQQVRAWFTHRDRLTDCCLFKRIGTLKQQ